MAESLSNGNPQAPADDKYRIGTLQYTKAALFAVFSWLLWGDLCFQLFESAGGPGILGLYLQDNFHVSNVQVNILFNLIPQLFGVVMGPIISFKSDRTRSRWGRRIPYMVLTAPFLCLFAVAIGYSDEIVVFFKGRLTETSFISPFTAAIMTIGFVTIGFTFFNEFVGTVYWYLFADVVPQHFLGRFMGMFRVVGTAAGLLTNAFIVPHQLTHMKAIHVGIAVLYFFGFTLMCWRVKEGEYPPVTDVTEKSTFMDQVRLYFRECFNHPIFIMFYIMTATTMLSKGLLPAGVFNLHVGQHQGKTDAHWPAANAIAMTPDGAWCATGGGDGLVKLWKSGNGGDVRLHGKFRGQGGPILCVAIAPDGRTVVAGSANGWVEVWDSSDGRCLQRLTGHEGAVNGVALSRDGRQVVSGGADKTVKLWDIRSGQCLRTLEGHEGPVKAVAFSTNADRVVSGGSDKKIIVWDAARGVVLKTLEGSPGPVYAVCFAPALQKMATPVTETKGVVLRTLSPALEYFKYVLSNESLYDVPPDTASRIVSEDAWVLSGGRDGATDAENSAVRIWNAADGSLLREMKGHKQAISGLAYKPDIRIVLSGSLDGSVRLWYPLDVSSLAGDQSYKALSGYTHAVTGMASQRDGPLMTNVSNDGTLHVWDIDQGVSLRKNGMSGTLFLAITLLLAYPFGALVDRFHPIRIALWMAVAVVPFYFLSFFLIKDYLSGFWLNIVKMPFAGLASATAIPLQVMLLPKAKYGQMSSANALVKQLVAAIAGILGALLMDRFTASSLQTDAYRYGFLFQGIQSLLFAVALFGVYHYWKKLGGDKYVAPES